MMSDFKGKWSKGQTILWLKRGKVLLKIEIRCKTCGKLHMEVEVEGRVICDFKCKKCKTQNTMVITKKFS